jgi:LacI family transcriptional regulator
MSRQKKVSLFDLAKAVGASKTLVSIVLNGKARQYRISEEMELKVIAKAKELHYSPNLVAQNLRGGKSQLIGVVVTDISNPFYANIARMIEDRASELNYTVLFSSTDEDQENTSRLIDVLINKGVDGLIVVPCDGSEKTIAELYADKFPLVLVDRYFPNLGISYSCLNNHKATELATQHLIDQGYEKISIVSYKTQMNHIVDRIAGYEDTMVKAGLRKNINIKKINLSNPKLEMRNAMEYLVKKKVDAIICLTNMLSIDGIYCLNEMNVKIPEDIGFVGFNRSDVFNLFSAPITYIKQPVEKIAYDAINMLIDIISGKKTSKTPTALAEPELVIQASSPKIDIY